MRAKFIYEKFTQNSDPVADLGIGMIALMRKDKQYIESHNLFDSAKYLFNEETFFPEVKFLHNFLTVCLKVENLSLEEQQLIYNAIAKLMNVKKGSKIISQPSLLKFFKERYGLKLKRYS